MVSELSELIARYEAAKKRVVEIVDAGPESAEKLFAADRLLAARFSDILEADLDAPAESILRIEFLLEQIKSNQSGNRLVERLVEQVWQDVVESKEHLTDFRDETTSQIVDQK